MRGVWRWLVTEWQWPNAALFAAVFLIVLSPVVGASLTLAATLVYAQLPAYLVHQWEEHTGDRFRAYVNNRMGGGRELLTRRATFWINSLGVWALIAAALLLAVFVRPGAGLVAGYLSLLNGLVHAAQAARFRGYNPGLLTAAGLLIPLGLACVVVAGREESVAPHAASAASIVLLHLGIVAHAAMRWRRLDRG